MKAFSKVTLRSGAFVATMAIVLMAGSVAAFAVPAAQVHRSLTTITLAGGCCQDVPGETVKVTPLYRSS